MRDRSKERRSYRLAVSRLTRAPYESGYRLPLARPAGVRRRGRALAGAALRKSLPHNDVVEYEERIGVLVRATLLASALGVQRSDRLTPPRGAWRALCYR